MKSGIYAIKNVVNGKVYVGKSKDIIQRKYSHFGALRANKHGNIHLQRAYNKYGKDSFDFIILEYCCESSLPNRELYYIALFSNNYNIIQSIDNRQNFPQDMKDKMRLSKIYNGIAKAIYSYNMDSAKIIKWDSIKECAKRLNLDRRCIQAILKGSKYSYKRYRFNYTGIFSSVSYKHGGTPPKQVFVYSATNQFIGEYCSLLKCSKALKISRPYISKFLDTGLMYSKHYFYTVKLPS